MSEKEDLIRDIKVLISTVDEETVQINPNYLNYFEVQELQEIKDGLLAKKRTLRDDSESYLDEIYEKTKKDEI